MTSTNVYNGIKSNRGERFSVVAIEFSAFTEATFHAKRITRSAINTSQKQKIDKDCETSEKTSAITKIYGGENHAELSSNELP